MKHRMKINMVAVVLAVMMICVMPVRAFAAGVPSVAEVRDAWLKGEPSINFSDYYFVYTYNQKDRSGNYYDFTTITLVDNSFKGQLFAYRDDNSTPVAGNIYFMSYYDDKIITGTEAGVYVRNATYYNINGSQLNSSAGLGGGYDMKYFSETYYASSFSISNTNIPLFDSKESAENYFNTGDTSGLLNGDSIDKRYDSSIETPKNLKLEISDSWYETMGWSYQEDASATTSITQNVKLTWEQSEDAAAQGYSTEVYYQVTQGARKWYQFTAKPSGLTQSSLLKENENTGVSNTFFIEDSDFSNWYKSNLVDSQYIPLRPVYFYIRNVKGSSAGNWVKIQVTDDGIKDQTIKPTMTVTGGYTEIKGDTPLPGNDSAMTGPEIDGQYGSKYSIDVDDADISTFIDSIKSGFGLLGDDGLIAFFKEFFDFLPDWLWVMIKSMVAICCLIVVMRFVRG